VIPIPAIDIRDGRCVRLLQGDFSAETVYGDPLEVARGFAAAGAELLHVVDLDAARRGEPVNDALIAALTAAVDVPVQVGGGVRSRDRATALFAAGVARVVLGTAAVEDPGFATELATSYPGAVVVGLDHRVVELDGVARRVVAVRGWEESGGVELTAALAALGDAPVAGVVVTDITRDGMMSGPDLFGYRELLGLTALPLIASGGIGSPSDLTALAALESGGRSLVGAIVGRALVSGAMSFAEAVDACAP
jgi:phosphoribosylformimino-5-aminoimidazole carboxamide ribotide isomerase